MSPICRRSAPRGAVRWPAKLIVRPENSLHNAGIRNFSHGGLYFETDVKLRAGVEVMLRINAKVEAVQRTVLLKASITRDPHLLDAHRGYGYGAKITQIAQEDLNWILVHLNLIKYRVDETLSAELAKVG